ncbi:MAG: HU family DNA-binding protein [Bacteroidales bacterium]|nr:HU family DNA-binding protein [Bacteroidales bacterium]
MNQNEFIKNLAVRLNLTQAETKKLLKSAIDTLTEVLDQDITVTLPGLGTFNTATTKRRKSFSPHHDQMLMLPPKRTLRYSPSSTIKNELKSKHI